MSNLLLSITFQPVIVNKPVECLSVTLKWANQKHLTPEENNFHPALLT